MRRTTLLGILCAGLVGAACGGGGKKPTTKPKVKAKPVVLKKKPETEEDRAKKRLDAAHELIPDGTNCLPAVVKDGDQPPALELGTIDSAPVVCAFDTDQSRLLGPIACWKVELSSGALAYREPSPLPGRGFAVRLDGRCARGYCLPDDVALPTPPIVHIAWSNPAGKVAVAIPGSEPEIHIFGADDKAHQGVIKPKDAAHAEKGLTTDLEAMLFVGDVIAAVGSAGDEGAPVFLFKTDGTPVGAVERLGGKVKGPVSVAHGSASVFGDAQFALNEDAMTTLTTIEVATGKRAKLVRKPPKTSCKAKDLPALIAGTATKVSAKCQADYDKQYAPMIGAGMVQGKKNHLALLRGARLGELAVLDAKTLEEGRHFAAAWCEAGDAADKGAADGDDKQPDAAPADE